jgi:hypothetical protein
MTLGVILGLFGLGTLLVLLFTLAVYAVPFFVGLTAGLWAYDTGAGVLGALLVGLVTGVLALFAAQLLFASVRSLALRGMLALLFAVPAAVASYHAVLGIAAILVPSEVWRQVFAAIGGLLVGASAAVQLASFAGASAPDGRGAVGLPASGPGSDPGLDQRRALPPPAARLPAPSAGSRA